MSGPTVNEMTGEVTFDLSGKEFRIRATMARLADYQSKVGVVGLQTLSVMVSGLDARAIYLGLKCLCTSDNADTLDDMLLTPYLELANEAIVKALSAGLPEASSKKAPASKGK